MTKPAVLILGSYPPPFGGVPRHLEEFAPFLVSNGWDVHLIATGHTGTTQDRGVTVYRERRGRKLMRLLRALAGVPNGRDVLFERTLADLARHLAWVSLGRQLILRKQIRLIAVYNVLRAPAGLVLSEQCGIPLVVTNFGEIHARRTLFERHRAIVERMCRASAKLLAISHHCAASYRLLGIPSEVTVIPYGVDTQRFSTATDAALLAGSLGIASTDPVVLFVGRMLREMGLHTVLEAIPRVWAVNPGVKFLVVGAHGGLTEPVRALAAQYPGRVLAFPDVPFESLPQYYAMSSLAVAPTQGDRACSSLAALEAMASGKPVIGARAGGVVEAVDDGVTGLLVPPEDAESLARGILQILALPDRGRAMGQAGRRRVETSFNRDRSHEAIEAVFRQVGGVL